MASAKRVYNKLLSNLDRANDGSINGDNKHETEYMYCNQSGDVMVCYEFADYHHYRLSIWQTREEIDAGAPEIWTYVYPVNYGPKPNTVSNWHHIFDMI